MAKNKFAKELRIGIFTLFRSASPGTFFQARATIEMLQTLLPGSTIELIDLQFVAKQPAMWWLKLGRRNLWKLPNTWRAYRTERLNRSSIQSLPRSRYSNLLDYKKATRFIEGLNYDALIVGSDEILRLYPAWPICENYPPPSWLSPALSMPRYMLAASAGTTRWDRLSADQKSLIGASVQGFRWIGVRDPMTMNLLKAACGPDAPTVEQVPDPTFAFDMDRWCPGPARLPSGFGRRRKPLAGLWLPDYPWVRELARKFRAEGYETIALDGEIGGLPSLGPYLSLRTFPKLFRHFDLVITGSLHYTIFSLRNGVCPIAIDAEPHRLDPQTGQSKAKALLAQFELERNHHIRPRPGFGVDAMFNQIMRARAAFDPGLVRARCQQLGQLYAEHASTVAEMIREDVKIAVPLRKCPPLYLPGQLRVDPCLK